MNLLTPPSNQFSRRNFFRNAGIGTAAIVGMPLLAKSCTTGDPTKGITDFFSHGNVVVFQGDSITDAGRNKERELPMMVLQLGVDTYT
jgi:hypothetical protein